MCSHHAEFHNPGSQIRFHFNRHLTVLEPNRDLPVVFRCVRGDVVALETVRRHLIVDVGVPREKMTRVVDYHSFATFAALVQPPSVRANLRCFSEGFERISASLRIALSRAGMELKSTLEKV